MTDVYKAAGNNEGLPFVEGPGNGLGYYSHTLCPELTCGNDEEAERAAKIANIAYGVGYAKAQRDIRKALGI